MGISIQITDAEFSYTVGSLTLPDRSGLVAEYLFGDSEVLSVKNRAAPGLADATVVGAPVYSPGYVEIKSGSSYGSVGFETGLYVPSDATLIVVVQNTTNCPSWLTAAGYNGFLNYTSNPLLYNGQSGTAANVADVPYPATSDFVFFAGKMPAGGFGEIVVYEAGSATTAVAESAGSGSRGTDTLKVGTTLSNSGSGVANIAYAAVFNRVLSSAEIADAYASLKSFLATRGVTVS